MTGLRNVMTMFLLVAFGGCEGFGPPVDFNLGSSAWGAYRALGQGNLPSVNWGSLSGVNVNSLLHPSVWDSISSSSRLAAAGSHLFLLLILLGLCLRAFVLLALKTTFQQYHLSRDSILNCISFNVIRSENTGWK